jgi:outer membrane receptor for ferrienterochelin and colicins
LLDQDFTTYDLQFASCTSGSSCFNGTQANYVDDYNNKDKARNLWLSVNVKF